MHSKGDVQTGVTVVAEPAEMLSEEWKRALVVAALVQRHGGEVRIPFNEIVALENSTIQVSHDHYLDTLIIRVT